MQVRAWKEFHPVRIPRFRIVFELVLDLAAAIRILMGHDENATFLLSPCPTGTDRHRLCRTLAITHKDVGARGHATGQWPAI
jgi:hypothetical protein